MGTAPHPDWINPPSESINLKGTAAATTSGVFPLVLHLTVFRPRQPSNRQPDFLWENPAQPLINSHFGRVAGAAQTL